VVRVFNTVVLVLDRVQLSPGCGGARNQGLATMPKNLRVDERSPYIGAPYIGEWIVLYRDRPKRAPETL